MEKVNLSWNQYLNEQKYVMSREKSFWRNYTTKYSKKGDKLGIELWMLMTIQTLFLRKFCGGAFYSSFKKLLKDAKVKTNHINHKPKTPIEIKAAVEMWPGDEELIGDVY